ncbi:MAG: M18 family aminopeptidase [Desulfobulbus sp.]|nr:M18 family aminopeptidase [Desulfobulbus sp.]
MMDHTDYLESLFSFIDQSPTAFHVVANAASMLKAAGFTRLHETDSWQGLGPGRYVVVRNDAGLIAFTLEGDLKKNCPLRMAGSHTDSPSLRVKPQPMQLHQGSLQLGVEVYGGALLAPWFDRNLSLAGRVGWCSAEGKLHSSLLDCKRPIATIPSLAIHFDREANTHRDINKQTDLVPLLALSVETTPPPFTDWLKAELKALDPDLPVEMVLDFDLFLYETQTLTRIGLNGELVTGSRLDNQLSCHALVQGLIAAEAPGNSMIVLNDHEEVGSVSTAGAQGPFLKAVLERLYPDPELRRQVLAGSFFISADNAHAVHPNFSAKHEPDHMPRLNQGPVIKTNANQRYATNGLTASLFRQFCRKAEVPCQQFVMRNDMACGSTIGPLTAAEIGVATVDVGVPQLAMHSIRETVGDLDSWYLMRVMSTFFAATDVEIRCPEVGA